MENGPKDFKYKVVRQGLWPKKGLMVLFKSFKPEGGRKNVSELVSHGTFRTKRQIVKAYEASIK